MGTTPHSINHHGREEVEHSTHENHLEQDWMERSRTEGAVGIKYEKNCQLFKQHPVHIMRCSSSKVYLVTMTV